MHHAKAGYSGAIVEPIEPRVFLSAGLLTDINHKGGSKPRYLADLNGVLYFSADDGIHGRELWRADGTGKGTAMVKDLLKGGKGSNPVSLTNLDGELYFATDNATSGTSFWKSDGTAAGTVLIKQISPQRGGLKDFTLAGNTIYFEDANPYTPGLVGSINLYASDGTAAGTRVIQTATDNTLSNGETFQHLISFKRNLFFFDVDEPNIGTGTAQLFRTDGVQSSATPLRSFDRVTDVVVFNGALYFGATDPTTGDGLWKSDGTVAGTKRVAQLGNVQSLAVIGNTLYFAGETTKRGAEPYTLNGNNGDITLLKDINPGVGDSSPDEFTGLNGKVIFRASNGVSGSEPWITDGTKSGTHQLKDINTNPDQIDSFPTDLTAAGDKIYFIANDFHHGQELWETDGTSNGTQRISDFVPGRPSSDVANLTDVDGTLFFTFDDNLHGIELGIVRSL
jgi:ELWxxDGT repeat protein